ncbi:MAG: IS1182 family transposase [Pseudomonadota bacterium]
MARYKDYNYEQGKLIPISFREQILPGTFEHTLSYLIDHELDLSVFDQRYHNDATGAPAYDPALLLKIVLYAYSRGITSSRRIERCCRENIIFMALSADTQPHFTSIAGFISQMEGEIVALFRNVRLICDAQGLIGREMFAIDGCKLPSNASKEWSGTKAELNAKRIKLERAIRRMLKTHRERDVREVNGELEAREQQYIATLKHQVKKLRAWLGDHDDKPGKTGKPRKSNVTDNDSAKMRTSHGVIQGYDGVAAVDDRHQVVVHAEAFGEAQEHDLLQPMLEATQEHFAALGEEAVYRRARITADSGFHTERNAEYLYTNHIEGYLADNRMRSRDPRFQDVDKYKARSRAEKRQWQGRPDRFTNQDFRYDPDRHTCLCPAGKSLYSNGSNLTINGYAAVKFTAPKSACRPCHLRSRCLKFPDRTEVRQVAFFTGEYRKPETFTQMMKRKIDSLAGKAIYHRRIATVEPVFGHLRNLGLDRFTLRGKPKVDAQWKLYCIVHNLLKIHRYGVGFG